MIVLRRVNATMNRYTFAVVQDRDGLWAVSFSDDMPLHFHWTHWGFTAYGPGSRDLLSNYPEETIADHPEGEILMACDPAFRITNPVNPSKAYCDEAEDAMLDQFLEAHRDHELRDLIELAQMEEVL